MAYTFTTEGCRIETFECAASVTGVCSTYHLPATVEECERLLRRCNVSMRHTLMAVFGAGSFRATAAAMAGVSFSTVPPQLRARMAAA